MTARRSAAIGAVLVVSVLFFSACWVAFHGYSTDITLR